MNMNILVSACLLDVNCKYNGASNKNKELYSYMDKYNLIPVCPEQLGGMPTPRYPCEILGGDAKDVIEGRGKVVNSMGEDVTYHFIKGAEEVVNLANLYVCNAAILKSRSPSCGVGKVYDGSFTSTLKEGNGICAELLKQKGFEVYTEMDFKRILKD